MNPLELQVLAILSRVAHGAQVAGSDRTTARGDSTAAQLPGMPIPLERTPRVPASGSPYGSILNFSASVRRLGRRLRAGSDFAPAD